MRSITKTAGAFVLAAGTASVAAIMGTGSANAIPIPPYAADCSGRHGDVNAHRVVRYNNTYMRKYNNSRAQVVATLAKNKRLHIFYQTADGTGKTMWASRAYVKGRFVCGYVYTTHINWHKSW